MTKSEHTPKTFKYKIYRLMNGKKVWLKRTNNKMQWFEMIDAMLDKFGPGSVVEQTRTSVTFKYIGG